MLLINVVTVMTAKRDIIRNEASKGHFILSTLEADLLKSLKFGTDSTPNSSRAQVFRLLTEAGVSNALVLGKNNNTIYFGNTPKSLKDELMKRCRKVIQSEKQETNHLGGFLEATAQPHYFKTLAEKRALFSQCQHRSAT
jgi:hypothetical protein